MSNGGTYEPRSIEPEIYRFWEEAGYFHAEPDPEREPYTIVIPPPNVTGALHLGHALNNTLQDILIRRARMQGYNACWLPGSDHAGIATQAVVERRLKETEGKTRHEIGREGLVKRIWAWKEEYNDRIINQLRTMGCSCDWERTRFTLDETCARAVYETFFRFFKDGLIYRGLRLVNWDAQLQTAVANDEVYHETVKSSLWHIRYPVWLEGAEGPRDQGPEGVAADVPSAERSVGSPCPTDVAAGPRTGRFEDAISRATAPDAQLGRDFLVCATTRPETMLGDAAVAVHPDDERYKHLIGKHVLLPLQNRPIPVIADGMLVKKEFGTGCVKVTPGHDPNDYACGQRHELEIINILTPDGKINAAGGAYEGHDRYAARKEVVKDLEALGLMDKIEPYQHDVGHSDRSKTPIEPMLSEQWFVRMERLAEPAMEAVRDGRVRFFPERFAKSYLDWLGEKRDWCISRQLWWGHRIPVWTFKFSLNDEVDWDVVFLAGGLDHLINGSHGYQDASETNFCLSIARASDQMIVQDLRVFLQPPTADLLGDYVAYVCYVGDDPAVGQGLQKAGFEQDPDVLDTWFSSALWPHSTFGWPTDRPEAGPPDPPAPSTPRPLGPSAPSDLSYFYPTNVLSTARDIISLWVARMVMTGLYNVGRVPFSHVTIHPTIQDGQGRRMSKTAGNGVDPIDIIDMYGTDAMRFTLAQLAGETQDIRMPVKPATLPDGRTINTSDRFELGRNFCNKLWQAATGFVFPNLTVGEGGRGAEGPRGNVAPAPRGRRDVAAGPRTGRCGTGFQPVDSPAGSRSHKDVAALSPNDLAVEDHWILSRLSACIEECDRRLGRYQYNEYINAVYAFFWSEFCDWYVELVKPRLFSRNDAGEMSTRDDESSQVARRVLAWVLDQTLRLLHPVMPFITEELWKQLNEITPMRGIDRLCEVRDGGTKGRRDGDVAAGSRTGRRPAGGRSPKCSVGSPRPTDSPAGSRSHKCSAGPPRPTDSSAGGRSPKCSVGSPRPTDSPAGSRSHNSAGISPALIVASWPDASAWKREADVEREMQALQDVIRTLREIRNHVNGIRSAVRESAIRTLPRAVVRADADLARSLKDREAMILRLGQCDAVEIGTDVVKPPESASKVLSGIEVFVPLTGLADLKIERQRLTKERDEITGHLKRLEGKLGNEGFVAKAPAAVVEKERTRLGDLQGKLAAVERNLAEVGG